MNCMHTRSKLEGHQLCIFLEGAEEGMELEQERIIKLLKDLDDYDWIEIHTEKLIALIKGEK